MRTVSQWRRRYREEGEQGLLDRCSTPKIWVQKEYERILDELGPWAEDVEPDRDDLARQYDEKLARGFTP